MKSRRYVWSGWLLLLLMGQALTQSATNNSATEHNGYVIVEAEAFVAQEKTDKRQWHIVKDGAAATTASGKAYLKALPDTRVTHDDKLINGENFSNKPGEMAVLHYRVRFTTPGRYYVWARAT